MTTGITQTARFRLFVSLFAAAAFVCFVDSLVSSWLSLRSHTPNSPILRHTLAQSSQSRWIITSAGALLLGLQFWAQRRLTTR